MNYTRTDERGRVFDVVRTPPGSVLHKWTVRCDGEPMIACRTRRMARRAVNLWTRPLTITIH